MACILLWSSGVRVHDSQAYRKMNVTRERISLKKVTSVKEKKKHHFRLEQPFAVMCKFICESVRFVSACTLYSHILNVANRLFFVCV